MRCDGGGWTDLAASALRFLIDLSRAMLGNRTCFLLLTRTLCVSAWLCVRLCLSLFLEYKYKLNIIDSYRSALSSISSPLNYNQSPSTDYPHPILLRGPFLTFILLVSTTPSRQATTHRQHPRPLSAFRGTCTFTSHLQGKAKLPSQRQSTPVKQPLCRVASRKQGPFVISETQPFLASDLSVSCQFIWLSLNPERGVFVKGCATVWSECG